MMQAYSRFGAGLTCRIAFLGATAGLSSSVRCE